MHKLQDSFLWRLKLRLQFTGWLQFLVPLPIALLCLLVAGLGLWIGRLPWLLVWLPAGLGALLLLVAAFDLLTLKLGLRPPERIPRRRDELDVFELMRARRSCRSFQARDLTPEHRAELLGVLQAQMRAAPLGVRPVRFEYVAASLTVWPAVGAHEFLVAIASKDYDRLAVIDVGLRLQKVVVHATRMGLGTCWIGPGASHESVERHLGARFDPASDHVICVCALGYPSRLLPLFVRGMNLAMHRRLPLSALFFRDPALREPLDSEAPPFRAFGPCYEACRWAPSSYNGQTTRALAVAEGPPGEERVRRVDFFASTASRYYAPVAVGIWCACWELGCDALGFGGGLRVLGAEERGPRDARELPRYDISWIADGDGVA